jgi:small redox-active disulfide protein 2
MKTIQVLGPGCDKCDQLTARVEAVLVKLRLAVKIERVTDIEEILACDVFLLPALAIDSRVVMVGSVPSVDDLTKQFAALIAGEIPP